MDLKIIKEFVFIPKNNIYYKVNKKDILYVKADYGCIIINTKESKYSLSSTISRFKDQIDASFLISIHRSYLINLNHISSFDTNNVIVNKISIPMSKSGQEVLNKLIVKIKTK